MLATDRSVSSVRIGLSVGNEFVAGVLHDDATDPKGLAMRHAQETLKPATRLLDFRFNYIPAAATDIAATWRRFGFDPHTNKQRREQLRNTISGPAAALIAS